MCLCTQKKSCKCVFSENYFLEHFATKILFVYMCSVEVLEVFTVLSHCIWDIFSYKRFDAFIYCCLNYSINVQFYKLSKSLLTARSKVLEKQGVSQIFKKLSALNVTYPCFAVLKKYQFTKNYVTLPILMLLLSFLNQYVSKIFL